MSNEVNPVHSLVQLIIFPVCMLVHLRYVWAIRMLQSYVDRPSKGPDQIWTTDFREQFVLSHAIRATRLQIKIYNSYPLAMQYARRIIDPNPARELMQNVEDDTLCSVKKSK